MEAPASSLARRLLFALVLWLLPAWAGAEVPVPPLAARVTDLTSTLSGDQRTALENKLAAFEKDKGTQIAVLIVPTTQPETIEQYAVRVFQQWKLGRKGIDDGALLVVAKNDRKVRIEVGYGLEGILPDAGAKRIIEEDITPRFRQNDFYGGIDAGVARMMKVSAGEPLPPPSAPGRQARSGKQWNPDMLIFGVFGVAMLGGLMRSLFGRLFGAGIVGAAAGAVAWFVFGLTIAAIVGFVAFLFSLMGGSGIGRGGGSGWSSGGGGGFGGGGGGGGFSGGGGSSGGGGASGSW